MRRSASSVTSRPAPEPDVSEHFRRSLSGKWPRRQTNYVHYTPPLQTDVDKKIFGDDLVHPYKYPYVIHLLSYFSIYNKKKNATFSLPTLDVSKISGSLLHCKINQTTGLRNTPSCNASSPRQIVVNNSGIESKN